MVPSPACTHCGKNFTTDDLRRTHCAYCGTVLAHHQRAAEQVAVIQGMMADRNGNGIPDAFEPMVQNAQHAAMNQAFGGYGGPVIQVSHVQIGGAPMHPMHPMQPPAGGFGGPMPGVQVYGAPASPFMTPQVGQEVSRAVSRAFLVIGIVVALMVLMSIAGAVFFFAAAQ